MSEVKVDLGSTLKCDFDEGGSDCYVLLNEMVEVDLGDVLVVLKGDVEVFRGWVYEFEYGSECAIYANVERRESLESLAQRA
jgi:hypothetical protein